jgi:hypothetical protein
MDSNPDDEVLLGPAICNACHMKVTVHRDYSVRDWSRFPELRGKRHICTGVMNVDLESVFLSNQHKREKHGFVR